MKTKYLYITCILSSVFFFGGCKDYLTEIEPGTDML